MNLRELVAGEEVLDNTWNRQFLHEIEMLEVVERYMAEPFTPDRKQALAAKNTRDAIEYERNFRQTWNFPMRGV